MNRHAQKSQLLPETAVEEMQDVGTSLNMSTTNSSPSSLLTSLNCGHSSCYHT